MKKQNPNPIVLDLADEGWFQELKTKNYYAISSLNSLYLKPKDRKQGYEVYKGEKLLKTTKYLKEAKKFIEKRTGRKVKLKY